MAKIKVFDGSTALSDFEIPETVTSIDDIAFQHADVGVVCRSQKKFLERVGVIKKPKEYRKS